MPVRLAFARTGSSTTTPRPRYFLAVAPQPINYRDHDQVNDRPPRQRRNVHLPVVPTSESAYQGCRPAKLFDMSLFPAIPNGNPPNDSAVAAQASDQFP